MEATPPLFQQILKHELARRSQGNPRYSLRAFSKSLDSSVAYISRVLSGKRIPSAKRAQQIADRLCLSPDANKKFVESALSFCSHQKMLGIHPQATINSQNSTTQLDNEMYDVIGDVSHMAILELTFTNNFNSDTRWIAKQLGITHLEAQVAVSRLVNVGLLKYEGNKLVATNKSTTTKDKSQTSAALKRQQKQILEKAVFSLLHDPLEIRNMSSMTMAIDPKKMPLAREMIQGFMEQLCEILGGQAKKTVYQLGVSLYPLQKPQQKQGS